MSLRTDIEQICDQMDKIFPIDLLHRPHTTLPHYHGIEW